MISNLNDITRENIFSMEILDFIDYFRSLKTDEQEKILRLLLIDYYKINFHDQNKLNISNENVDSILLSCLDNSRILYEIVELAKRFYSLDYFSRTLLIEEMEMHNKDKLLSSICKAHFLDKFTYKIVDDIDLYKEYYLGYMKTNEKDIYCKNLIINYFCLRVLELKYTDLDKYKKYILEFIKVYYKWKKFIKEHEGMYLLNIEDFLYIEKIETENVDKLYNYVENSSDFFRTIVSEFLHYTTSKLEVKESIVDKYLNDTTNEAVKTKLKIKDKESK